MAIVHVVYDLYVRAHASLLSRYASPRSESLANDQVSDDLELVVR